MSKKHYLGVDDIHPMYNEDFITHGCGTILEGIRVRIGDREDYFPCDEYEVFYPDVCHKRAQDETWEFVKTCMDMSAGDLLCCFGVFGGIREIFKKFTYTEAKEKYDAWVKKNTVKEMTVEEISEALGYNVKIVAKKEQA